MRWLSVLITLISSLNVYANCELGTWRFHTIAVYELPDALGLDIKSVHKRDGGLLFISDLKSEFEKGKYLQKIDGKFGSVKIADKSFSLENANLKNVPSVRGDLSFLKLKDFLPMSPAETYAVIDAKQRTISVSGEKYFPLAVLQKKVTDVLPGNLSKVFKATMARKDFSLITEIKNYSEGQATEWTTQKLGEKDWELVQIKAKFSFPAGLPWNGRDQSESNTIKIKTLYSWVAFLTNNGKDFWYIGNSSGDPCGHSLNVAVTGTVENETATIGRALEPQYGFRFTRANNEIFYSFGDANIVYYLNFGKDMVVISNESYR